MLEIYRGPYLYMVQSDLLPCLPGHTTGELKIFSFLVICSPPLSTQKETIPHPRAPDRPHIRIFWVDLFEINNNIIDFRTTAKRDVFTTFINVSRVYLEEDSTCIMWVKHEQ